MFLFDDKRSRTWTKPLETNKPTASELSKYMDQNEILLCLFIM